MKTKKILSFVLTVALLSGCEKAKTYTSTDYAAGFDTVYSYTETTTSEDAFQQHFEESRDLFSKFNDLFDIYHKYSDYVSLMEVNENAGKKAVKVNSSTIDLLNEAKRFYELSDGEFDITMGAVLSVWHTYREAGITQNENGEGGKVPTEQELQAVSGCRGWDKIEIDEEESTVYINDPCVSLDVGGIAKGFSAEKIAEQLEAENVTSAIVNAGRNIRTIGAKTNNADWRVGIANPIDSTDANGILTLSFHGTSSFVTSGDYERYYTGIDGKTYCHIIDPETLYPADFYHSVTIITKDSTAADALSTTLFTMTIEDGKKVLQQYETESGNSAEAVWIMDPEKKQSSQNAKEHKNLWIVYTDGLSDVIEWND